MSTIAYSYDDDIHCPVCTPTDQPNAEPIGEDWYEGDPDEEESLICTDCGALFADKPRH